MLLNNDSSQFLEMKSTVFSDYYNAKCSMNQTGSLLCGKGCLTIFNNDLLYIMACCLQQKLYTIINVFQKKVKFKDNFIIDNFRDHHFTKNDVFHEGFLQ